MLRIVASSLVAACVGGLVAPGEAAAQQTFNVTLGYFTPRGEDARVEGDVLNVNRADLVFDVSDFNGPTVGAEWLVPFGDYFEGGIGVGFSRRTVASVYADFVDSDGSEIEQDLRLRIVPVAFTVRFTPLGRTSNVQPYVGAGLGIFNWRYSEAGEFVNFRGGNAIFEDRFVASGTQTGPVVLGGVRVGGDNVSVGGEVRFQSAEGELNDDFVGSKIDLGGWTYQATFGFRF